jgi:hypothetical protein
LEQRSSCPRQFFTWDREGDGHLLTSAPNPNASPGYTQYNKAAAFVGQAQSNTYDPFGRRFGVCRDTAANCAGTWVDPNLSVYVHDNFDREIAMYDSSGNANWLTVFDANDRAPVAEIPTPLSSG